MRSVLACVLVGCADDRPGAAPQPVVLPELVDLDPDEGRFEGEITAAPALVPVGDELVAMLAYEGSVPGPVVRARLGDTVVIRFRNELPEGWDTSVHWHGIEGYNASDGTPTTQHLVHPGEGFTYAFRATRPGTYWYHPHHRGAQALFSGLYAPLVVEDPAEDELVARGVLPEAERVLVLSDTSAWRGTVTSAESDNPMEVMNGTEGRTLLVNGRVDPLIEIPSDGVRLRIVNASITRFWRLAVPDRPLVRVGGEGGLLDRARVEGGLLEAETLDPETLEGVAPTFVDSGAATGEIVLAPGERAEVVLRADLDEGEELELRWEDVARGRHGMWMEGDEMVMGDVADDGRRAGRRVATLRIAGENGNAPGVVEAGTPLLEALGLAQEAIAADEVTVDWTGELATTLDERMDMWEDEQGIWQMSTWLGIRGEAWAMDHHGGPGQPLAPTARRARIGEVAELEIRSESGMAHPYHLHGFSFQPIAITWWGHDDDDGHRDVEAPVRHLLPYTELEDTVIVPGNASVHVRVRFHDPSGTGDAAGRWMEHCHILQHGENGMMSEVVVER